MILAIDNAKSALRAKNESVENIKQVLRWTFALLGFKSDNLPDEAGKMVLVDYILKHGQNYSLLDIENAFTLYVQAKLDYKEGHYQTFSVLFLENVLQSYRRYVINLPKVSTDPHPVFDPSPQEIEQIMIQAVHREYGFVKSGNDVQDFGNGVYNFLAKKGLINFTKEKRDEFKAKAREILRAEAYTKPSYNSIKTFLVELEENRGDLIVTRAKKIALQEYFREMIEMEITVDELFNK